MSNFMVDAVLDTSSIVNSITNSLIVRNAITKVINSDFVCGDAIAKAIMNSDLVRDAIAKAIDRQCIAVQQHFIKLSLKTDILNAHLSTFKGALSPSSVDQTLRPNITKKITDTKDSETRENLRVKCEDEVVIVLNYGPKSHAIFGDFAKKHVIFKDNYLKKTSWVKANNRLAFGFGWVVMNKSKLGELKKAFNRFNIEYRTIKKRDYENEIRTTSYRTDQDFSAD